MISLRCEFLNSTGMKKILFAISVMTVLGITSSKETVLASGQDPAFGCIYSPCQGRTICRKGYAYPPVAAWALDLAELPCNSGLPPRDKGGPRPPYK